jgi:hypothetical protein
MRIQFTATFPLPTAKSLASGRICVEIATAWEATCWPSMKKVVPVAVHVIRYWCGAPSQLPGIWVDVPFVRANRAPPVDVENIAHGWLLKSTPNPTCWNAAPLKVAPKSRVRPGKKVELVPAEAPSTVNDPPATVAAPPACHGVDVQPEGKLEPENSSPAVGMSRTSPSPACPIKEFASGCPAEKSTTVVSVSDVVGVLKLAGGSVAIGEVASLFAASVERTRKK